MNKMIYQILLIFGSLLLLSPQTLGQQQPTTPSGQSGDSKYVDFTGFKGKIFEVRHRNPDELVSVLRTLTSGFKGSTISADGNLRTISVRDFPENIAVIEEALKRLDVPPPPNAVRPGPRDIEIVVQVILASGNEADGNDYPAELKDVITQLQSTLNFKSFHLLTTISQRSNLQNGFVNSSGTITTSDGNVNAEYKLIASRIKLNFPEDDSSISIGELGFSISGSTPQDHAKFGKADLHTRMNVRNGEKVVVGTATIKDKAVILVLTANIL